MGTKRIIGLNATTDFESDDNIVVDSTTAGTRKMAQSVLKSKMRDFTLGDIHNLSTTITAFRTGDVIPVDGPSGDSSDASNKVGKLSADTMSRLDAVVGNTPMLDGKHVYNPNTCTPGTITCGDCFRDEYCEKARLSKKAAYEDRQRLAARPTIVKLTNPECDPAGGYFHYFKLDKDGKTMLNDNELESWMVDAAISEKTYDALGGK